MEPGHDVNCKRQASHTALSGAQTVPTPDPHRVLQPECTRRLYVPHIDGLGFSFPVPAPFHYYSYLFDISYHTGDTCVNLSPCSLAISYPSPFHGVT